MALMQINTEKGVYRGIPGLANIRRGDYALVLAELRLSPCSDD